ncbi:unnamed protein product [Rhizoctonia solani]|uniref:C2H2-type domain-containing protein n=1 Tax=Rhizoctonia solani TaxID=456999 RepID=A0A8H3D4T9_9AGAM|nr:unnamed protein product [Rhizoctonia solani]
MGQTLCSFARNLIAERVGSSQSHLLDSFPIPQNVTVPLHPHLTKQDHPPEPNIHVQPRPYEPHGDKANPNLQPHATTEIQQLHPGERIPSGFVNILDGVFQLNNVDPAILLNPVFGFEESWAHHSHHSSSLPNTVVSGQPHADTHLADEVAVSSSEIGNNSAPENYIVTGSGPTPGPSTTVVPVPGLGSNKNTCPECGKKCRRASDLQDHMHVHDGIKRHSCEFCGAPFAFRNNMGTHKKTCKLNPGL